MKVKIYIPPQGEPFYPMIGVPAITAYSRQKGYDVEQIDENVKMYDKLLSEGEVENAYKKIISPSYYQNIDDKRRKRLEKLAAIAPSVIKGINKAKSTLKSEDFYDSKKFSAALKYIHLALSIISEPYYPSVLGLTYSKTKYSAYSTDEIIQAVFDENTNIFMDYFKRYTIPEFEKGKSDIVGISISGQYQVIPGLTLCNLLKRKYPNIKIIIGGNFFSRQVDVLSKDNRLFQFFDYIVMKEGEHAFEALLEFFDGKRLIQDVPNLCYMDDNRVIVNNNIYIEDCNELPTLDFDGIDTDLYLTPELILPISTSRGCVWGKCSFCAQHYGFSSISYRDRLVYKTVEDIKKLKNKYGVKNFAFADHEMIPEIAKELSEQLIKENIDINWTTNVRLETEFSEEICSSMSKAGCKKVYFGLESASDRILKLMNKGTNPKYNLAVIKNFKKFNINTYAFFFFGFPTETVNDAEETIKFLVDNCENIDFISNQSPFILEKYSDVYNRQEEYGVNIITNPKDDLALIYDYTLTNGLSKEQIQQLSEKLDRMLSEKHTKYGLQFLPRSYMMLLISKYKKGDKFKLYNFLGKD